MAPAPKPIKPKDNGETQPLVAKPVAPWYKRYAALIATVAILLVVGYIFVPIGCGGADLMIEDEDSVNYQAEEVVEAEVATTGSYNGHDWVDLGLSVKWATCNVGASSPSGYGDYYAWGELSTKSEYTESNSRTYNNSNYNFNICGNSSYDVARYKWGSPWRLPSAAEIDELKDNCTWEWTMMNGVNGYKVKSKRNSNWIFLPAAGWRGGSSFNGRGSYGNYWSGTPYEDNSIRAYYLSFGSGAHGRNWSGRYYGRSVRPVSE